MDLREALRSQYRAALEMLKETVARCPESLWNAESDKNRFWHVAYHTLFFTHLYLQSSRGEFRPWAKHRDDCIRLGPASGEPYSKEDVLAYLDLCRGQVEEKMASVDLDAESSGFAWLPFGKLELQLYNLRHLQHHVGELMERLGTRENVELAWVASRPA